MAQLWMLLLLILPVYALFSLPLLAAALWRARKGGGRKRRLLCGLAGFALLVCCVGANCGLNPAAWNRELAANALSRAGWPSFQYDYEYITEPLHSEIGLDTARKVSAYADGVEISLIPRLEERYTPEETTSVLWELARFCLKRNLRADVKNVVWDMAAYHATPPILAMQLKGPVSADCWGMQAIQLDSRRKKGKCWIWSSSKLQTFKAVNPGALPRKGRGRHLGSKDQES